MPPSSDSILMPTTSPRGFRSAVGIYLELAKARLTSLVALTTAAGYILGSNGDFSYSGFFWTVVGTGLAGGGSNGLNQAIEAGRDALMDRTKSRPIPSGRMDSRHAYYWSLGMSILGVLVLLVFVNALTAALGALTVWLYVTVYTPLKTRTSLNTLVGAVCGAIPPIMGWSGATGTIGAGGLILGAILFTWQIPHFLALAWLYRTDYERGGYRMLPIIDRNGSLTCRAVILYSIALVPVAVALSVVGVTGWLYAIGSVFLGALLISVSFQLDRYRTRQEARRVFLTSLAYLSLLIVLMFIDRSVPEVPQAVASSALQEICTGHLPQPASVPRP